MNANGSPPNAVANANTPAVVAGSDQFGGDVLLPSAWMQQQQQQQQQQRNVAQQYSGGMRSSSGGGSGSGSGFDPAIFAFQQQQQQLQAQQQQQQPQFTPQQLAFFQAQATQNFMQANPQMQQQQYNQALFQQQQQQQQQAFLQQQMHQQFIMQQQQQQLQQGQHRSTAPSPGTQPINWANPGMVNNPAAASLAFQAIEAQASGQSQGSANGGSGIGNVSGAAAVSMPGMGMGVSSAQDQSFGQNQFASLGLGNQQPQMGGGFNQQQAMLPLQFQQQRQFAPGQIQPLSQHPQYLAQQPAQFRAMQQQPATSLPQPNASNMSTLATQPTMLQSIPESTPTDPTSSSTPGPSSQPQPPQRSNTTASTMSTTSAPTTGSNAGKDSAAAARRAKAGLSAAEERDLMASDPFYAELLPVLKSRGLTFRHFYQGGIALDFKRVWEIVQAEGGYAKMTNAKQWRAVGTKLGYPSDNSNVPSFLRKHYTTFLVPFETAKGLKPMDAAAAAAGSDTASGAGAGVAMMQQAAQGMTPTSAGLIPQQPQQSGLQSVASTVPSTPFHPLSPAIQPGMLPQHAMTGAPTAVPAGFPQQQQAQVQPQPLRQPMPPPPPPAPVPPPLVPPGYTLLGVSDDLSGREANADAPDNDRDSDNAFPPKDMQVYEYKKYHPRFFPQDLGQQAAGLDLIAVNRYLMDILQGGFELTGMTRLRAAIRNDPTQVAADLAVLDVRALTCQLASGLQHEVASALNVLLVTSVVHEAPVPVDQSPQLVRAVAEVAVTSLERALEMIEVPGGEDEASEDDVEYDPIAYLLPMDRSVSESDQVKVTQLLETAVESLQVLRNWSFDHKRLISSLPRVLGVLARVVALCLPRIDQVAGTCGPWWRKPSMSGIERVRLRPLGRSHAVVDALVTIVHQVVVIVSNVVLDLDMSKLPTTAADAEAGRTPKRNTHLTLPTRSAFLSSTMDLILFWLLWTRSYLPRLNLTLCTLANHPTALHLSPAIAITSPGTTALPDGQPPTSSAPFIGPADAVNAEHLALHALAALLPRIDPATCDSDLARNPVASTLLFARVGHLLPLRGFMDTAMIAIRGLVGLPVLLMPCLQCHPMPVVDIVLGLMQGLDRVPSETRQRLVATLKVVVPLLARAEARVRRGAAVASRPGTTAAGGAAWLVPPLSPTAPTAAAAVVVSADDVQSALSALAEFPDVVGLVDRHRTSGGEGGEAGGGLGERTLIPWDRIATHFCDLTMRPAADKVAEEVRDAAATLFVLVQECRPT